MAVCLFLKKLADRTGKYRNAEEVLEIALKLLDEYERSDAEWVKDVQTKIDAAISISEQTPPIDGETFINQILKAQFFSISLKKMVQK